MTGPHLYSFEKNWKDRKNCLDGSFISGFKVAYHPMIGLDGFKAYCTTKHGSEYDWLVHHSVNQGLKDLHMVYHCANNN